MSVKFCRPTNLSPPATRPVVGSTPELVWKKDSRMDKMTGIPATTSDDDQGRRQQDPGQPALAIAQRVLLVLVAVALGGRQTPRFRGGCRHAATSFVKCAEFPAQHLAAPGTSCGHQLLDQSLQLGLQCLQGRIGLSLTLECAVGGILDRQGDVTVLHGLRTWLGALDRLELRRHERELLGQIRVGVQLLQHRGVRGRERARSSAAPSRT